MDNKGDYVPGIGEESFTIILDREWQGKAGLIAFIGEPKPSLEGHTYKIKVLKLTTNGEFDTIFFKTIEELEDYENKLNEQL